MKNYKKLYFILKTLHIKLKDYLSGLNKKRQKKDRFIVEVPTTMESESDKNKLMADILDILEHQIKLH
jgi:hypothetical protein|tara:strand:- start:2794 stop:2997 length:204 start_codon:yes stop_codon:yes gene_type:complete